jgi:hypothetical protein
MATATTMYHTSKDPLHKVSRASEEVQIVKSGKQRKLHKAYLRYHDPKNWGLLRESLKDLGREDLIGHGSQCLIPPYNPKLEGEDVYQSARKKNSSAGGDSVKRDKSENSNPNSKSNQSKSGKKPTPTSFSKKPKPKKGNFQTQHTGLPPRKTQ